MVDACKAFEKEDQKKFGRSVRIQIPRILVALYEIRNNRGVGHVGGDVNPNHMDSVAVLYMTKWIMGELVRLFHGVDTQTATQYVDTLVERNIPIIWEVSHSKRVLKHDLSMKDKALALLYSCPDPVTETDLRQWVEHSNTSVFRQILVKCHKEKLIEYNRKTKLIHLSPKGSAHVELHIPMDL